MQDDYYSLLGVSRFATQDALRRAFRTRILALHPDRNPGNPAAAERTRETIEAYHVLSNPQARHGYDWALVKPVDPVHLVTTPSRSHGSPQWVVRFCLVLVCLAVVACVAYGIKDYIANRTMVFRPQLGVIDVSPTRDSPMLMGRAISSANENVAREDRSTLASNIVSGVCLRTALCSQTRRGIHLIDSAAQAAL